LIVHEALMVEPTETESVETLDEAIAVFEKIWDLANENPEAMHSYPKKTPVGRLDDVKAARTPVVRYTK
jgi:glycine dehydrogenase subunit 2